MINHDLSPSEERILPYVVLGYSNKEIGQFNFISEVTVKFHLGNIFEKTKVKSRSELIAKMYLGSDKFHELRCGKESTLAEMQLHGQNRAMHYSC